MATKWVMIRVEAEVHAELVAMRDRLEKARVGGQVELPDADGPLPLGEVVGRLIRHVQNDKRRQRETISRQRQRKAAARSAAAAQPPQPGPYGLDYFSVGLADPSRF